MPEPQVSEALSCSADLRPASVVPVIGGSSHEQDSLSACSFMRATGWMQQYRVTEC